jgi:signal transduction histidine kinase/ActR/RegA family two-component response regulator
MTTRRKDGVLIEMHMTISPVLDSIGTITKFIAQMRDVTKERALEAQFRQSQKMESIGQLAGGVAHDFNNILTVIMGFAGVLLADRKPGDPSYDGLRQIEGAAHRAADLTRQLLAFSRKQVVQPRLLQPNSLVEELRKMLSRLLGEDIHLELDLDPQLPTVEADVGQVEQVLLNLAVNARDAMPQGGRLRISTSRRQVTELEASSDLNIRPGPFVQIAVSDNGVGMSPEVQKRVFEPFFTTKAVGKGTGLGLSTVFGIVRQHGGWVEVQSTEGVGSTFLVFLPAAAPAPRKPPSGQGKVGSSPGRGANILLVEDEEPLRRLVSMLLQQQGYAVHEAASAEEARRQFHTQAQGFAVVLSDVVMPGGSGLDLAMALRTEQPSLRVVLMSGYSDEQARLTDIQRAGIAFMQKPFTPSDLFTILARELAAIAQPNAASRAGIPAPVADPPPPSDR